MLEYRLKELKQSASPVESQAEKWFYYVISNDRNIISGYREGSRKEVAQYLKDTLTRLNSKFTLPSYSYQNNVRKVAEPGPHYSNNRNKTVIKMQ